MGTAIGSRSANEARVEVYGGLGDRALDRRALEAKLGYQAELSQLVADLAARIVGVGVDDLDALIEESLGAIARFAGVNAGYVMRFDDERASMSMTHLWSDGALTTQKREIQDLPTSVMPWWMGQVLGNRVVAVASLTALPPEAAVEQAIMEPQGVRSVIDVPMAVQGKVVGMLGFTSTRDRRQWSEVEVSLLRFTGQVIISALMRHEAEFALRDSEAQLRQAHKLEAIGRLAGGIAHDFNNLLTGISGYAEMAALALEPDSPALEDIHEITKVADRASQLTRQLLAFSRKQPVEARRVELNALVERSQRLLTRVIGEHIELRVELAEGLGPIEIDPGQLDQILVNLVTNAGDAMPEGGVITIETRAYVHSQPERTGKLPGDMAPGDYVELRVRDEGLGMAPELAESIFEPFFTTKPEGKGTGLGLSTVYGILRQHGGHISVDSVVGEGTTMRVFLPMSAVEDRVEDAATGRVSAPRGSGRILLVEDEDCVRKLGRRMLEQQGYTVAEAETVEQALILADAMAFDLLVTDVVMPQMNGPTLLARIRDLQPEIACLFVSGYTDKVVSDHGLDELDAHRFVHKPFKLESLAAAVHAALARAKPEA